MKAGPLQIDRDLNVCRGPVYQIRCWIIENLWELCYANLYA